MEFRGFEVYDDNGELLEIVPAILTGPDEINATHYLDADGLLQPEYVNVAEIVAQLPPEATKADFVDAETGELIASIDSVGGRATVLLQFEGAVSLTVRVGLPTMTKLNELGVRAFEDQ